MTVADGQLGGELVTPDVVVAGPMLGGALERDYTLSALAAQFLSGLDTYPSGASSIGGPSDPYRSSLWFNRCISKKATNAARVPIRLSRGDAAGTRAVFGSKWVRAGRVKDRSTCRHKGVDAALKAREGEIVESGELYELLARPNPAQRWNAFIEAWAIYLDTGGRVHWLFDEMAGRRPLTMELVPGAKSAAVVDESGRVPRLRGWRFTDPRGGKYPVAVEECLTFQVFDPADPFGGLSPRTPGNLAIVSDYNASLYNAAMFANNCEPGTVLETDAPFNPDLDATIRTTWQQRHAGAINARKLAVMWGGMTHKSVGQTLSEMVYAEGKQLTREEICAICDVPPSVAGFFGRSGDSDAYVTSERRGFWQDTIVPLLDKVADAINGELCPRFDGGLEAWFDLEDVPIFQEMRRAQTDTATKYFGLGVPVADLNDWLDLGLPERPHYETGFLPVGLQTVEQAIEGVTLPPMDEGPAPEAEAAPPAEVRDADAGIDKDAAERIWRAWQASWAPLATRVGRFYAAHVAAQCRQVVKLLGDALAQDNDADGGEAGEGQGPTATRSGAAPPAGVGKGPAAVIARILVAVFDDRTERAKFVGRAVTFHRQAFELGVAQSVDEAGLTGDDADTLRVTLPADPAARIAIQTDAVRFSRLLDLATRKRLRASLAEGLEAGEGIRHLADRAQGIAQTGRARALTTARNAVGQTLSRARRAGRLAGRMTHEIWIHSRGPGERREAHVAAEARYRRDPKPVAQPFVVNGWNLAHPRDPDGPPGETINCQCLAVGRRIRPTAPAGSPLAEASGPACSLERAGEDVPLPVRFVTYADLMRRAAPAAVEDTDHDDD